MDNSLLIEKFLAEEMNLSRKEIKLYLNLTKYGPTTILDLAEITGINRATTHVNIENLTQKGLVTQIKKGRGSRRLIMAEPAEKLSVIFKARKAKLEAAENQLDFITQGITNLKKEQRQSGGMEIRRYSGKDEIRLVYEDVLKAKEIRTYANTSEILKIFPGNIQKFIDAHKKNRDMHIWEIMKDSKETQAYIKKMVPERFFCRLVTEGLPLLSTDYLIFDGKVALIEILNGAISGIVIEDKNFYESSKIIHEFVWGYLPDYKK
jgi:predicted transcriptional regulator